MANGSNNGGSGAAVIVALGTLYAATFGTLFYLLSQQQNKGVPSPVLFAQPTPQRRHDKDGRRRPSITWDVDDSDDDDFDERGLGDSRVALSEVS